MVKYAGFWLRFAASFIDGLVLVIPSILISFMFRPFGIAPNLILGWLYYSLQESGKGQSTVGKRIMGIKVTDIKGKRISFGRATGRHFAKYISTIILFIGFLMAAFTEKKQALHDMIAETLVVKSA